VISYGWEGNRWSGVALVMRVTDVTGVRAKHRCKNVFKLFLFWTRFYVFYGFFIFQTFFILKNVGKVQSGKHINKKHFQNNCNEIDPWNSMGS